MPINQDFSSLRDLNRVDYPLVYTASTGDKVATIFISLLIAGGGALCFWYFATIRTFNERSVQYFIMAFCAFLVFFCFYAAMNTFRFRFTLYADRVDYQSGRGGWSVRRENISNWRIRAGKNTKNLELISTESGAGVLKCTLQFKPDAAFDAWFADLPNADRLELKASEDEIRQNPAFGSTPEERLNTAARARNIAKMLTGAAFGITLWANVYPHPYNIPIWLCIAIPWLVLVACWQSKGLYTLGQLAKKSAKADLTIVLMFSAFGLMMCTQSASMVHWSDAIVPGVVVGLMLALLVGSSGQLSANDGLGKNESGNNVKSGTLLLLFCSAYAIAVIIETNKLLDNSVPENYPVKILAQRQTHGKGAASFLTVSAWGPRTMSSELTVNRAFYDRYKVGDMVCVHLHSGAYRLPWFSMEDCNGDEISAEKPASQ